MTSAVSSTWDEILRLIPGYDPFHGAEGFVFDEEAAQRPVDFFAECLTHVKGDKGGQPFILEPWQRAIVGNLFGWKRPDGTRRYREAFIFVPRKQGKTLLAASICNFLLFCDGEWGAEIYAAAKDREQAGLVFDIAKQQIVNEPVLAETCEVWKRSITIKGTGSFFKSLSSVPKHGFNPHGIVVDELHEQKNRDLVEALTTGIGARSQPLVIYITTSDFERESICNEKHKYSCKIRSKPKTNPHFLPVIYEATRDDDWKSPDVWAKCNPGLGISVPVSYLEEECARAREIPAYENTFKRLYLNIRTEQAVRWIPIEKWDACGPGEPIPIKEVEGSLEKGVCYGGLDLASTADVAAFVLVFPPNAIRKKWSVIPYFWVPEENARTRDKKTNIPYLTWERHEFLETTAGNVIDYDHIRSRINELEKRFDIREIAFDRWNATQICEQLTGDGFNMVAYGQGFKDMTAPSKELDRLVLSGLLDHHSNPVLRWMAGNVMVVSDDAGNLKPSKKKSEEKIDGIVALIMGIGRALVASPPKKSVYTKDRGLQAL